MRIVFTFVLLLGFSQSGYSKIFNTHACHPKITKACPIKPSPWKGKTRRKRFKFNYKKLAKYYKLMSNGWITENPLILQKDKFNLKFRVDLKDMVITPLKKRKPEFYQSLFIFNFEAFTKAIGSKTFLEAKRTYYKNRPFNKIKLRYKKEYAHLSDWKSLFHPPVNPNQLYPSKLGTPSQFNNQYHQDMDAYTGTELTRGNKMKLYVNNQSLKNKLKDIKNSKEFIFIAVMSFSSTPKSYLIVEELVKKAQAGLDVRVILEKVWGRLTFNRIIRTLKKGGVKVALATDFLKFGTRQGLFHSKYMIFDGLKATMGGQNLVSRSHLASGFNHYNKDTDVHVAGPVITDLLADYLLLWRRFTNHGNDNKYLKLVQKLKNQQHINKTRGSQNYADWIKNKNPGLCRFISQGPHKDKHSISRGLIETFGRAQKEIIYTSQHVSFTREDNKQKVLKSNQDWATRVYRTLIDQVNRGLPIDLITNGIDGGFLKSGKSNDGRIKSYFNSKVNNSTGYLNTLYRRPFKKYLHDKGFHIWNHFQYIHSKVALIDKEIVVIGSYNFETYSADNSHETTLFCQDPKLVKQLNQDLKLDRMNSTPFFK